MMGIKGKSNCPGWTCGVMQPGSATCISCDLPPYGGASNGGGVGGYLGGGGSGNITYPPYNP